MFDCGESGTFEYSMLYFTRTVAPLVVCAIVFFERNVNASKGLYHFLNSRKTL